VKDGDVVLTLGAGSIGGVGDLILHELRRTLNAGTLDLAPSNGVAS